MSWSKANLWCTTKARDFALEIAEASGDKNNCGVAAVVWVAAVWNESKGRAYDYKARIADMPSGPRAWETHPLFFEKSIATILKEESSGELTLDDSTLHTYGSIHDRLEGHDMPIFIRLYPDEFTLHYVTLYKSHKKEKKWAFDRIKFYWQDNGLYGRENDGNPGLYATGWRAVGESFFLFGAKRVKEVAHGGGGGGGHSGPRIRRRKK